MRHRKAFCRQSIHVATLALACLGCQSQAPAVRSLPEMKYLETRKLAAECYSSNEGFRFVYGNGTIWGACMTWADQRVDPPFPSLSR
jgi:hypothetical protein